MTTEPEVTCPGAGTAPSNVSASVDLPDPDSPTRPVTWPRARSSDTPATAGSGPAGVGNDTVRLRTRTAADASGASGPSGPCSCGPAGPASVASPVSPAIRSVSASG